MNDTNNINNSVESNTVLAPTVPEQPVAENTAVVEQPVAENTPVVEQQPEVQTAPVTQEQQPVQESVPLPVSDTPVVQESSNIDNNTNTPDSDVKTTENKENKNDDNIDETDNGKIRFPVAIVIIIVLLAILATVYYYVIITPANVFDKAINDIVDSVKETFNSFKDSENDLMNIVIDTTLTTSGPTTTNDPNISFVNGVKVGADVDIDIKNLNFGVMFNSDLSKVPDKSKMSYGDVLNFGFDYVDKNFYLVTGDDKSAKYTDENGILDRISFDYSRISDFISVFEDMKDKVLELTDDNKLDRSLVIKKIEAIDGTDGDNQKKNNQTALAIKVHTKLDYDEISKIYHDGFTQLYQEESFIKKLSNSLSMTEEDAKKFLEEIINRETVTKEVEINLYMNLANTQIIGLDVTVDKYYVEINNLNGYYYIDIRIKDENSDINVLDIEASYDNYYGILNIYGEVILKDQTFLAVEATYTRTITDEKTLKSSGNILNIAFYDEDSPGSRKRVDKPFCTFIWDLSFTYNELANDSIELTNPDEAIELVELDSENISNLVSTFEKVIYEFYFVYGRLFMNRKSDSDVEKYIGEHMVSAKETINSMIANAAGSISYEQLVSMTKDELKEKMKSIEDLNDEQKTAAYDSIVNNIKNALTYDEINKLEYDKAKELLKDKLDLLDNKYKTKIYDAITEIMVKEMTYEKVTSITLDEEKSLVNKASLLPSDNQKTIFNHIIDEIKNNVTYDQILKMTLDEEKDLLSRVDVMPNTYKNNAYKEIASIITSSLKYNDIVSMSNDEIKALMKKVEVLPSTYQKTIISKVVEVINKEVTASVIAKLSNDEIKKLLAKVDLLPSDAQKGIYNNVVAQSIKIKEKPSDYGYSSIVDLLPKVCILPDEYANKVQTGVSAMCSSYR